MKVAIVLGTSPEIIKMAPIVRECVHLGIEFFLVHSGQHYSFDLDRVFFEQLGLPQPEFNLEVGSGTHAVQTAKIMIGIENVISKNKPDFVLVEGDTNTVLATAIATTKLHVRLGHLEAGLRSQDKQVLKILAIVSGLFFAGLAYLQYQKIVNINWNKLQATSQSAVTTLTNATTQISNHINNVTDSNNHAITSLTISNFGIPLTGMALGFAIGFLKG